MKGHCGCGWSWVVHILLVIGGLNWGLVGIGGFVGSNWNVVNLLLGSWPSVEWIVYILVGLAALLSLFGGCRCKKCMACKGKMGGGMDKPMGNQGM